MYSKVKTALIEYLEQIEKDEYAARCHLSGNGAVESLENKIRDFYGVKHALCVDSATNGLLYLAFAVGLKNMEIVTTPLSYGATISGALWLNNKFHFADIDNTLNLSPDAVREVLKNNPHIKALYAVDFAGTPHNIFAMRDICDEFGIWYFSDAAQSLGAEIKGLKASSLSDAFVVSFSPGKTIFCGEGACLLTNDTHLYKRLVSITQHPYRMKRDIDISSYTELGLNGRINPIAAIIGDTTFQDCLLKAKTKQLETLKLYNKIDKFHSISLFQFEEKGLSPVFYYLPLLVNNKQYFKQEFHQLNCSSKMKYNYYKATFELLPEQLKRIGKAKSIKSCNLQLSEAILKKLFLLHHTKEND